MSGLGGWAIGEGLFAWTVANLPPGAAVLELGSGTGSVSLASRFRLLSLEHDLGWVAKATTPVVYAPIVDGWYHRGIFAATVAALGPLAVIVDGPPAIGRAGFVPAFSAAVPPLCLFVVFDDTDRPAEAALVDEFLRANPGWTAERHADGGKEFTVVSRGGGY